MTGGVNCLGHYTSFRFAADRRDRRLRLASGTCPRAGLTPSQIIANVVANTAAYNMANPSYGFVGDFSIRFLTSSTATWRERRFTGGPVQRRRLAAHRAEPGHAPGGLGLCNVCFQAYHQ
jgi:hypothetical protein